MSGEEFNNHLHRRSFLKLGGLFLAGSALNACNYFQKPDSFKARIVGANSKTGHLLREGKFPEPSLTEELDTIIVGGGVSGLSAARWLKKKGIHDFKLLELDDGLGGNSRGGKNSISEYPIAAHYLPLPNENFHALIDFLSEHKVITGFDSSGLPIYNEDHLCFEPQERLFYRGIWYDGLPPKSGLMQEDQQALVRFLETMEKLKTRTGSDGLPAFTIPLELSSKDEEFTRLDTMTVAEYLERENYKSEFLSWYLSYCCRDDFGTSTENTSAWAMFHYFVSRNGRAANASSFDVLVWPEGNYFLVKKLSKGLDANLHTQMLSYKVEKEGERWSCYVYDIRKQRSIKYSCRNVILCTPQFVNKRLLSSFPGIQWEGFSYYPWVVANISLRNKKELNGMQDLSWDNVIFSSGSLGYVNACHQSFNNQDKTVLTWYYNFSERNAREEREAIYDKDEDHWKQFVLNDLKIAHPQIEELIEDMEITVLGHGMISPCKGFLGDPVRATLAKGIEGLYFAHTDVSGVSIFEQAFYQGIRAAEQIIERKGSYGT